MSSRALFRLAAVALMASGGSLALGLILHPMPPYGASVATPRWAIAVAVLGGLPFAVNFLLPRPAAIVVVSAFGVGLLGLGPALWKSVEQPRTRTTPNRPT